MSCFFAVSKAGGRARAKGGKKQCTPGGWPLLGRPSSHAPFGGRLGAILPPQTAVLTGAFTCHAQPGARKAREGQAQPPSSPQPTNQRLTRTWQDKGNETVINQGWWELEREGSDSRGSWGRWAWMTNQVERWWSYSRWLRGH